MTSCTPLYHPCSVVKWFCVREVQMILLFMFKYLRIQKSCNCYISNPCEIHSRWSFNSFSPNQVYQRHLAIMSIKVVRKHCHLMATYPLPISYNHHWNLVQFHWRVSEAWTEKATRCFIIIQRPKWESLDLMMPVEDIRNSLVTMTTWKWWFSSSIIQSAANSTPKQCVWLWHLWV